MGRKRKNESSDERMRRKIRKYQDRLAKKRRRGRSDSVVSIDSAAISDENNDVTEHRINGYEDSSRFYYYDDEGDYEELPLHQETVSLGDDNSPLTHAIADAVTAAMPADMIAATMPAGHPTLVATPAGAGATTAATPTTSTTIPTTITPPGDQTTTIATSVAPALVVPEASAEPTLNDSLLSLLGDAPKPTAELGPPIHRYISLRWQEILSKGLKEENKNKIIEEYTIPNNLDKLVPPTLNAEVISALASTPAHVKRDFALQQRQKQIGIALAALSKTMNVLLSNNSLTNLESIIKPLSDGCRLLCELFHNETRTRRAFIISSINSQMKDQIIETEAGKFLFGDNLADRLKTAQNIHRSANILQPLQNKYPRNYNNNLNVKTPYRRPATAAAVTSRPEAGRFLRSARGRPPPPPQPQQGTRGYRPQQGRRTPPAYPQQRQQRRGPAPQTFHRRR